MRVTISVALLTVSCGGRVDSNSDSGPIEHPKTPAGYKATAFNHCAKPSALAGKWTPISTPPRMAEGITLLAGPLTTQKRMAFVQTYAVNEVFEVFTDLYLVDPVTGDWSDWPNYANKIVGISAGMTDSFIALFPTEKAEYDGVWMFDLNTKLWRHIPAPEGYGLRRFVPVVKQFGDELLVLGGEVTGAAGNIAETTSKGWLLASDGSYRPFPSLDEGTVVTGHSNLSDGGIAVLGPQSAVNPTIKIRVFDKKDNVWKKVELTGLKGNRDLPELITVADELFLAGGFEPTGTGEVEFHYRDFYRYDFGESAWREIEVPEGVHVFGEQVLEHKIFFNETSCGYGLLFDPVTELWQATAPIPADLDGTQGAGSTENRTVVVSTSWYPSSSKKPIWSFQLDN